LIAWANSDDTSTLGCRPVYFGPFIIYSDISTSTSTSSTVYIGTAVETVTSTTAIYNVVPIRPKSKAAIRRTTKRVAVPRQYLSHEYRNVKNKITQASKIVFCSRLRNETRWTRGHTPKDFSFRVLKKLTSLRR
jgi:hypothetical protein